MAKQTKKITKTLPNCYPQHNSIFTHAGREIIEQETNNRWVYVLDMCSINDVAHDKIPGLNVLIVEKAPGLFPYVTIAIFNNRLIAIAPVEKHLTTNPEKDKAIFNLIIKADEFMQIISGWLTPAGKARLAKAKDTAAC